MPTVSYSVDDVTNFANPERGFARQAGFGPLTAGPAITVAEGNSLRTSAAETTWWTLVYLNKYLTTSISTDTLTNLTQTFTNMRSSGTKAWLRFSYNQTGTDTLDAQLSQVLIHINQLKPILSANADVIALMDCGFVGAWGEWSISTNYGSLFSITTEQWSAREAIITALLDALPTDRTIQLRTPAFKQHFLGSNFTPMTTASAWTSTNQARLGHSNDAFLSSDGTNGSDQNTYGVLQSVTSDRSYVVAESYFVSHAGETDHYDPASLTNTSCTTGDFEMEKHHFTLLGDAYQPDVLDQWSSGGCLTDIRRKLGYRFQLRSSVMTSTATVGASFNVQLHIDNKGYAGPINPRTAYIVFVKDSNSASVHEVALASNPRSWVNSVTVAEAVSLAGMDAGTYNTYLWMPDAYASIRSKPEYAIRMANQNMWDSTNGRNALNQPVTLVADTGDTTSTPGVSLGTGFYGSMRRYMRR